MDLPNVFSKFNTKEKLEEKFIAVEIGSETVTTAVWQVAEGKTKVTALGTVEDWEESEKNNTLLAAIDNSLVKTLENVKPEPNKVMFGLQESWVEGDRIEKKHSLLLKEVCQKFEFEPIGFVVTTEAIIQLLKKQDGTPPTAILIRVNEVEIQVTVVNLGKVIGSELVARSEDISADVEEGLARFKVDDNLPSKILLFNHSVELEKLKQDLLSYNWLDKLPFLHFPKVEILEKQIPIKSVALAGGAEAAKVLGFAEIMEDEAEIAVDKTEFIDPVESTDQEEIPAPETAADVPDEDIIMASAEAAGFQTDTDIIKKEPSLQTDNKARLPSKTAIEEKPFSQREEKTSKTKFSSPATLLQSAKTITAGFRRLFKLNRFLGMFFRTGSKIKVAAVTTLLFFIFLLAGGIYAYWTVPKAELILYLKPRTFDKELTITIDPSASQVNLEKQIIPGKVLTTEVKGTKQKDTTGTHTVGEKAVGEVTIYNKTSSPKTFEAGTVLIGPNGLKFSLDTLLNVASASAEESDEAVTTVFGKAKAAITALSIGTEYNLLANSEFSLDSFSTNSYAAKNESELSGGTSREVQAVSQEDVDQLTHQLEEELKQQAADKLAAKEGSEMQILIQGAKTEVISQSLSHQVGKEAEIVELSLEISITATAYFQENFAQLQAEAVKESIPENYQIQPEESKTEITAVDVKDKVVLITAVYQAALVPQIDEKEVKSNIIGKYPDLAREYLESLPNYSQAKIEISPKFLPAKLKTFPRKANNISIEIQIEKDK